MGFLISFRLITVTYDDIWAHMATYGPGSDTLASALALAENRHRRAGRAKQAEARIRRVVNQYGAPQAAARNPQMALIQGTMLYASEPTWNGRTRAEGEYQRAINRMGRATLDITTEVASPQLEPS